MKKLLKRIAAVNDLSTFGKCSLTVVIPVLSAMGYEVCPIVTSYLSAHTGFENPANFDLSHTTKDITSHLEKLGVDFDAVFTGYIPTVFQMEDIKQFMIKNKLLKKLIMVDPVLGDDGKLYTFFDNTTVKKMRELCLYADVITPNYTEACFLANLPYKEMLTKENVRTLIDKLNAFGMANKIVITSVPVEDKTCMVVSEFGELEIIECEYVEGIYCGAGDVFSSILLGKLLEGQNIMDSALYSHRALTEIIKETHALGGTWEQGLVYEKFFKFMIDKS
ncbi:MAG: pyridoxamine kinase [Ruminococcaceae bacterium]|nr:pyridoxamine kinase [Oscillospiraceae bacterium]